MKLVKKKVNNSTKTTLTVYTRKYNKHCLQHRIQHTLIITENTTHTMFTTGQSYEASQQRGKQLYQYNTHCLQQRIQNTLFTTGSITPSIQQTLFTTENTTHIVYNRECNKHCLQQ